MKRLCCLVMACLLVVCLSGCSFAEYVKYFDWGFGEPAAYEVYQVGETYSGDGFTITYKKCERWDEYSKFSEPEDGYRFIRAKFLIENTGEWDRYFGSALFTCYADGVEADQHYNVSYKDNMEVSVKLKPGETSEGCIYYKVPVDAKKLEIGFAPSGVFTTMAGFAVNV